VPLTQGPAVLTIAGGVTLAPDKAFSAVANSCDTDELARQA
jgi:hypothetical protein